MMCPVFAPVVRASMFGVLAALAYSLNHPFSKTFLEQFSDPIQAGAIAIILIEVAGLIIVGALLLLPAYRAGLHDLLAEPRVWHKLLVLTIFAGASIVSYYISIRSFNAVYVATILNVFPLYYIVVDAAVNRHRPDWKEVTIFVFVVGGIVLPNVILRGDDIPLALGQFTLISTTPILYCLSVVYQYKFFGERNPFVYISASTILNAPLFIAASIICLYVTNFRWTPQVIELEYMSLFLIGGIFTTFVARYLLQRGREAGPAYVNLLGVWFFLIPIFSGLIGSIMQALGARTDVGFDLANSAQIGVLTLSLAILLILRERRRRLKAAHEGNT